MEVLKIVINSVDDWKAGKGILEGVTKEQITEIKDITIGILENGTTGGQPSLSVCLKQPDGKVYIGQITAKHFEALVHVYNGSVQRFTENKARKN